MAIIYTYPTKATPNANDLILISDSQDSNKTKQVTIASLPGGSGSGVSSVTSANTAITVADATTTPVLTSVAYSGGANIGHVPTGSGSSASVYLDGTGNWSTPSSTDTTINTKNSGSSVANPTVSLDFGIGLTAISGGGGAAAVNFSGGLNDLSDVSFTATANGSLYVGQISSQLSGTPVGNVTLGGGAAKVATTAYDNTIIGSDAAVAITEGNNNVAIGSDSAAALTTGNNNVVIGSDVTATLATGTDNVVIGKGADVGAGSVRSVIIGGGASGNNESIAIGEGVAVGSNELGIGEITLVPNIETDPNLYLPIKIKNSSGNMIQYYIKLLTP